MEDRTFRIMMGLIVCVAVLVVGFGIYAVVNKDKMRPPLQVVGEVDDTGICRCECPNPRKSKYIPMPIRMP